MSDDAPGMPDAPPQSDAPISNISTDAVNTQAEASGAENTADASAVASTEPTVAATTAQNDPNTEAPSVSANEPAPTTSTEAPTSVDGSATAAAAPATSTDANSAAAAAAAAEEASRKRRSRWAPAPAATPTSESNATGEGEPRKRSRWASKPAEPTAPAVPVVQQVLSTLTPEQLEAFKIQLRIDEITRALLNPSEALRAKEATDEQSGRARSPSPEPIYDAQGVRTNTRALRFVKQLERERQELIESLQRANPHYRPPAGFKKIKYERRLMIPIKEYPDYNFIGTILGPRGLTQKRMEKESGCKIVIRGKGSTKEGRANHRPQPGDDDDLHVLIQGDNEEMVIATTREVEKLLVPIDESKNEHKARQLRELAVINGTLRDDIQCRLCGQLGHKQMHCPQRSASWAPANIRCEICNSDLHPTADCPQRFTRTAAQAAQQMNDEYSSFMDEITGNAPAAQRTAQPLYLTDGAGGGGAPSGSSAPHQAPPSGGPGTSGFIHPDRLATRGPPDSGYRDRDGGSRVVRGADPRDSFREFRPAASAMPHLPAVSHRDGFRDAPTSSHGPPPHHYPPHHAYPPHDPHHHYGSPPPGQHPQYGYHPTHAPGYGHHPSGPPPHNNAPWRNDRPHPPSSYHNVPPPPGSY